MSDQEKIDHPTHYGGAKDPYEAIKVIRAWGLGFALGNAAKYICRAGRKPGEETLDDLKKARWYLDNEVEALGGESPDEEASVGVLDVPGTLSHHAIDAAECFEVLAIRGAFGTFGELLQALRKIRGMFDKDLSHVPIPDLIRNERLSLHRILDKCGLGAAPLCKRVERLSAAYKEAVDTLRAKEQPMPAVTRVRLEAERDEAIAKLKEERERNGIWREEANRTLDEERARSQRYREKQSAAERERDEARAGEHKALAEVEKLRGEIEALRYHERRGRWTTVRVDRLEHLEAIERRAQGPAGGYTAEDERVGIDPLLACEVKP